MFLTKNEILNLINQDEVCEIQEVVRVEFDNRQQTPLGFCHKNEHYEVLELIRAIRDKVGHYHYLVRTNKGIFNLVLVRENNSYPISLSKWVLNFQVVEK